MFKANIVDDMKKERVAFIICSNVIGGHEFQSRALIDDFAKFSEVTVFLNSGIQEKIFAGSTSEINIKPGLFFQKGWIGKQVLRSLAVAWEIRKTLSGFDRVVVCAGAVEAGICTSIALCGKKNIILYLPFFYDRTKIWGKFGHVYNLVLSQFGHFYDQVITINRIQAKVIKSFLGKPTTIVPNLISEVPKAKKMMQGRILFIGRLDRQKCVPELLDLLDFEGNPYREIIIIGDGPEYNAVAKKGTETKNLKVTMVGWKSTREQNDIIDGNDVLLLNSVIEGEPMVIREANARGVHVIARDIVGVRGVTRKKNRFSSQADLKRLLLNAWAGNLRIYFNKEYCYLASVRCKAVEHILI